VPMGPAGRVSGRAGRRGAADDVNVPARIINEHVYCPRLAWMEWEARAWADNLDTAEGTDAHRRVNEEHGDVAPDADAASPHRSRSHPIGSASSHGSTAWSDATG